MGDSIIHHTLVPLILRAGLAVIFIYHGWEKVFTHGNLGTGWHPDMNVILQALVAWGELIGGVALAAGFLTRAAAVGIAIIMAGAIVTVHGKHGFALSKQGFEYNFALLIICAALILTGGGTLAFDRWFRFRRRSPE